MTLSKIGMTPPLTNIYGRESLQKYIIFPRVRIKYRNVDSLEYNGISKTVDLKDAGLTEKNWAGACCGLNWFLVSNSSSYILYDLNGNFVKQLIISEVGELIGIGTRHFSTCTPDGIQRVWWEDGSLKDVIKLPDEWPRKAKVKILRKGEVPT
ncbi:MAG: hypothetical protein K2K72_08305 [Duncaniella sp.]|nr:hypothetical protein [Duncaniella sp.]